MITFNIANTAECLNVEGYLCLVGENFETTSSKMLENIETKHYPHLKSVLKKHKFEGKKGQTYTLSVPTEDGNQVKQFIFVGLGKPGRKQLTDLETLRRAVGTAIHILKRLSIETACLTLPAAEGYGVKSDELLKQLVITAHMADYEFTTFKTKDPQTPSNIAITVKVSDDGKVNYQAALHQGAIIGEAINQARHWCDLPANVLTPTALSNEAQKIADESFLSCTIFGREKALELGMGGFCGVDAGSAQPGKFVVLEYKTKEKNAPTIALVGKGITFDTGGISLKPSESMHGMKYDMSGAAAVIATMKIIAQLKPSVNVVGLAPIVENMPDGGASRQDDILTFMNGKTAEIRSTDAEGRLILADALCYAEKFYSPDVIIDIATLTGACVYALGYFFTGMLTQDDGLSKALSTVGDHTGDRVWALPMDDDFKGAIASRVADISNCGSPEYKAGTITASFFLQEFVKNARWAHLDIAGTADGVPNVSYLGKGSAGAGIRLFVEFLMNYQQYMA